jgi:very-short-patch-repair endonuclease
MLVGMRADPTTPDPHTPRLEEGCADQVSSQRAKSANPLRVEGVCGSVVVSGIPDQRLRALAATQWERVSRRQLVAIGFTPAMIRSRLRVGGLHRVYPGVYAVGHTHRTRYGDEVAALLAAGPAAVLSHRSAAVIWQFVEWSARDLEVTVPEVARTDSRPGLIVHRSRTLTRADIRRYRGLPITSPARTMVDYAETTPRRELERALDEGLARRLVSPTSVRAAIARAPGRRSTALLEELLDPDRPTGVTVGQAEERLLGIIRAVNLADPDRNVKLGPFTVDFLWRDANVAIEVDSYTWHSGPAVFKRDRRKDAYLGDHGIRLLRVTWEMMDEPLPLVGRIIRELGIASATSARRE